MRYNQYRFKFYLNASHAIDISNVSGDNHPHTWEILINTVKVKDSFVRFNDVEKIVEGFLSHYQDVLINSVEPFTTVNPTLENICNYFKDRIQKMLYENGWLLLSIEMSETPTRSYIISLSGEIGPGSPTYFSQGGGTIQATIENLVQDKLDTLSRTVSPPLPEAEQEHEQTGPASKILENKPLLIGAGIGIIIFVLVIFLLIVFR